MSSKPPRLRGNQEGRESLYPLGEFPESVIISIGRSIVHRIAVGHANIEGNDFAGIFAKAISGEHYDQPLGITDVWWNNCSWSVKTVQANRPFTVTSVRLISGRNSPDYSYGIKDAHADLQQTGSAVLGIWNERVSQSLNQYDDLRVVVFVRNMGTLQFAIFEYEAGQYIAGDYEWKINKTGNLEGFDRSTGEHCFTWQFHGSQFTVLKHIPASVYKFRIKKNPGMIEEQHVLALVQFKEDWIERVP